MLARSQTDDGAVKHDDDEDDDGAVKHDDDEDDDGAVKLNILQ